RSWPISRRGSRRHLRPWSNRPRPPSSNVRRAALAKRGAQRVKSAKREPGAQAPFFRVRFGVRRMDDLSTIRSEALGAVEQAADLAALDAARVAALGKKGSITGLMKTLGSLAPAERREFGARVNQLKGEIESALEARKSALSAEALAAKLGNER